jgi:hypothetical protein
MEEKVMYFFKQKTIGVEKTEGTSFPVQYEPIVRDLLALRTRKRWSKTHRHGSGWEDEFQFTTNDIEQSNTNFDLYWGVFVVKESETCRGSMTMQFAPESFVIIFESGRWLALVEEHWQGMSPDSYGIMKFIFMTIRESMDI